MEYSETRAKILESGKKWFLEKGFKSAPLRMIVKDAGFTLGAFYGYFRTKEELFYALTEEAAEGFTALVTSISADMDMLPAEDMVYGMVDCYIKRLPELVDYICDHKKEFELLLKNAEGTKYENFFDRFRNKNKSHVSEAVTKAKETGKIRGGVEDPIFNHLMRGYFDILKRIILEEEDRRKICEMMSAVAVVYKNGLLALWEDKEKP